MGGYDVSGLPPLPGNEFRIPQLYPCSVCGRYHRLPLCTHKTEHGLNETRVVDPDTGGEKGTKLARFDLIPVKPLWVVAEHYGRGAEKYSDRNWERGYKWSLSFAAMLRHAMLYWGGEDIDEGTGSPHLAAVVFHALALMEFGRTHPEKDDRGGTRAAE